MVHPGDQVPAFFSSMDDLIWHKQYFKYRGKLSYQGSRMFEMLDCSYSSSYEYIAFVTHYRNIVIVDASSGNVIRAWKLFFIN